MTSPDSTRRALVIAGACAGFGCSGALFGQSPSTIPRIGFLAGRGAPSPDNPDVNFNHFREGLRALGRIEGRNIHIEYRYADASRSRAKELIDERG